jgi:hypothetical protein
MLLAILIVGLAGTAVELLLLGHDESLTQLVPLILISIGVVVIIWHLAADSSMSLRLMRITMTAFVGAGVLGIVLHYQGSVEFQKELDPSITGFELFKKAMQSKAPPALAPGTLVQLGLLGLVCTYLVKQGREDA